jgi:hypothetical protein
MPFVRRDVEGNVEAVFSQAEGTAIEELPVDHADIVNFLKVDVKAMIDADEWIQADLALARVTEDLVDLLIGKGVINFTELPDGAQMKLLKRQGLRSELSYVAKLFTSEDDNFL